MSDLTCGEILNYSRIYGQKIPLEDVVQKIAQLDLSYIPYIAYLLAELSCPKSSIKSLYFRTKAKQITHKFKNLNGKGFISRQTISDNEKVKRFVVMSENPNLFVTSTHGLLYLSKYFYAYSNQSKQFPITEYKNFDQNKLIEIIDLSLMLADYIQLDVENKPFLQYRMLSFIDTANLKALLARSYAMYIDIPSKSNPRKDGQYIDFNQLFQDKYGYSIMELLHVYFCLFKIFIDEDKSSVLINLTDPFVKTKNTMTYTKILSSFINDIESYSNFSIKTIKNDWDYEELVDKPIVSINEQFGVILSEKHMQEHIVENFHKKLQAVCEGVRVKGKQRDFKSFYGKCYEKYVQEMCSKAVKFTNGKYSFQPEFRLEDNSLSSECYIYEDNKMLIIEAKSKTMDREKIYSKRNSYNMKTKIKAQFVDPIQEIRLACQRIYNSHKWKYLFNNITEIYSIAVDFDNCVMGVPAYHNFAITEIGKPAKDENPHALTQHMKYNYCFSIDELECLCWLLENGHDIFELLKKFYSVSSSNRFYVFLNKILPDYQVVPTYTENYWDTLACKMIELTSESEPHT